LLLTAWLPLVLYVSGFLVSGIVLAKMLHSSFEGIFVMALAQLVLGVWAGAVSVFWSVLLPQILASIVSVACVGLAVYIGELGMIGPGRMLLVLFETAISGGNVGAAIGVDAVLTLLAGGVWFAAASWTFSRRDLNLTAD